MAKTCADCAFHECTIICLTYPRGCSGYCANRKAHRQCDMSRCTHFTLDSFFKEGFGFNYKETKRK